jgi:hypothetical protein
MLSVEERKLIKAKSELWNGPNCWGWRNGYKLSLQETIKHSEYG